MDEHRFTPPSGRRSPERDAQVRTVTRITRGVAVAAVLGTAVFGGLAAAETGSSTSSPPATPTASATAAVDDAGGVALVPTASAQAPVASSGGS